MSKPISFGLAAKSKASPSTSSLSTTKIGAPKPISFPRSSASSHKTPKTDIAKPKKSALRDESEDEDDAPPKHEELSGFSSTGAILSKPKEQKVERVIESLGNSDWRKRGKNLLPQEVQAARNGGELVTVERNEVSKASGLQFAEKREDVSEKQQHGSGDVAMQNGSSEPQPELTEDQRALAALLDDGTGKSKSTAAITVQGNESWQRSETDDYRADVAARPDPSTLDEYDAMSVEAFGMALVRGMGRKRRANGEVINFDEGAEEDKKRQDRKNQGLLGIGAKPVKGLEGVELGAWGKNEMRKNARGEGFFTPVMLEDTRTGEKISEEESERRRKAAKTLGKDGKGEEDWRDRRDRNLESNGRDRSNVEDNINGSRKRDRSERDHAPESKSRSRRDRDLDDRDYDSSRSRRDRSRSKDRRRRDDDDDKDDRPRERRNGGHRDRYRDEDRYESSSSRKSEHRHRDRDRGDDRDRHRDRNRDGDDRRHRDRR